MKSIGKRGKTQGRIMEVNPFVIHLTKNGRAVGKESAKIFLKKHFSNKTWKFVHTDHSLKAIEIKQ